MKTWSRHLVLTDLTQRSVIALARGDLNGARTWATPILRTRTYHIGAASKCEHWRSIDLADLKRMGLLKPIEGGRIRAITWKHADGGVDTLGVIPNPGGIR